MAAITDPVADLLTRIRNANTGNHKSVDVPASKMKHAISQILKDEGFIDDVERMEGLWSALEARRPVGLEFYAGPQ